MIGIGALSLALAVGFGAFGAHALRGALSPYEQAVYEKAVFYHFIHGFGILVISLLPSLSIIPQKLSNRLSLLLVTGIILFSGSLYLLAITGARWFGAITPLGGLSFIGVWLWLSMHLLITKEK